MILHVHSDAAYLVEPGAKSRIAGYYFLSDHPQRKAHQTIAKAILVECKTLRHVVSSAAEAEMAGVHHNAQTAILIWLFLEVLQCPQPPTPIKTDNSTTNRFVHNNIHQRRSKSWDMRYHWLRDSENQKQFHLTWDKGANNEADYPTKRHPTRHHLAMRPRYVCDRETLHQWFARVCYSGPNTSRTSHGNNFQIRHKRPLVDPAKTVGEHGSDRWHWDSNPGTS